MDTKEVTIYDIAKKLRISPSTVSRGLKGHFTVSLKTQKKIASAAQTMGYRLNTFASNLRTQRTNTIGVIIPRFNSHFMAEVIAGMEKVTNESGYNLIISQSMEDVKKEKRNVKTMFDNRVDGLLVSLSERTFDAGHFDVFIKKGVPVLFFDRVPGNHLSPGVVIDNFEAGYTITKHLIDQGAKKILHISGNQSINVYANRFRGYQQALHEMGIPFNSEHLLITDLSEAAGKAAAIVACRLNADGVFAANDFCAVSCMTSLKNMGIHVPEDMLIAGFNNDMIARNVEPTLTSVNYPGFKMGEIAARNLLAHLGNRIDINETKQIILKSELIIRKSTQKNSFQ